MRIDLDVAYKDKDKVKKLGAKWDGLKKCWYVVDYEHLDNFLEWIPDKYKKPVRR